MVNVNCIVGLSLVALVSALPGSLGTEEIPRLLTVAEEDGGIDGEYLLGLGPELIGLNGLDNLKVELFPEDESVEIDVTFTSLFSAVAVKGITQPILQRLMEDSRILWIDQVRRFAHLQQNDGMHLPSAAHITIIICPFDLLFVNIEC